MFVAIALCSACFHSVPQKTVKTSTAVSSGPPRYVSWGVAAAAIRCASGRWSGTIRIGCCSAAADFLERGLVAMRRSLCEQMNSHCAGWGNQQAGFHTVADSSRNVNGTSHKRRTRTGGIYSGSECGIVPIRTRGDSMSGPIKVEIFGQVYSIQGELDAKYVQRLAKYVDEKMQAIADATKTVDTQKVAVLTALAIADELHSMQRERNDREELLSEQAERCLTLVERALKQTA
ncbi:MAG: hypothetical protein DMG44_11570 [Acidobacteria bacterium]|nr:MAG: hypothetical protein DMG44_11570 [Acidobacteriota bacterium]